MIHLGPGMGFCREGVWTGGGCAVRLNYGLCGFIGGDGGRGDGWWCGQETEKRGGNASGKFGVSDSQRQSCGKQGTTSFMISPYCPVAYLATTTEVLEHGPEAAMEATGQGGVEQDRGAKTPKFATLLSVPATSIPMLLDLSVPLGVRTPC